MTKENNIICELCRKVLGNDELQSHYCLNWCNDNLPSKAIPPAISNSKKITK